MPLPGSTALSVATNASVNSHVSGSDARASSTSRSLWSGSEGHCQIDHVNWFCGQCHGIESIALGSRATRLVSSTRRARTPIRRPEPRHWDTCRANGISSTALGASTEASGVKSVAVASTNRQPRINGLGAEHQLRVQNRFYRHSVTALELTQLRWVLHNSIWCLGGSAGRCSQPPHDAVARTSRSNHSNSGSHSVLEPPATRPRSDRPADPAVVVTNQDGVLRVATFAASGLPNSYCLSGGAGATCGQKADATGGGTTAMGAGAIANSGSGAANGCCYALGTFSTATGAGSTSLASWPMPQAKAQSLPV